MRISELENKLRKHAQITKSVVQPPFNLNEEIKNMEVHTMSKPKITMKRTLAIAAVLALCIITVTMTPLANSIKGFFSDIIRFDGAITGMKYENATNDIKIDVSELTTDNGNIIIPLDLTFENPTEAPFPYIQEVAVSEYKIVDSNNKEVVKAKVSAEDGDKGTVVDNKVLVNLSLNDTKIESGEEYILIIEKMYGLAKADAPLHITGNWQCKFVK
ncbi:MAG: DUF4179 domain-containing protein [Ruminococcaceae bacterium]|nr:DUF4179 domain-containing protein [Oscillospiraceae bacterium]